MYGYYMIPIGFRNNSCGRQGEINLNRGRVRDFKMGTEFCILPQY